MATIRWASLLGVVAWLGGIGTAGAAEALPPAPPALTPNFILVTNIVVVTNYVVTTNTAPSTNFVGPVARTSALPDLSWVPPEDRFDWIQLKSGEWLKGEIKGLQKRKLEFDSDELKDLTFDWKDIRQLRSPRSLDVLFIDGNTMSGPVLITPDRVVVAGIPPAIQAREQLQSVTPGGAKELNYWSGKVSVGLTLRAGNSEQVEYNAQAYLQRRTPSTRLSLDYLGYVSSVDNVESANNHRVNSEFDVWLSQRFYLIVPGVEYYQDPFQNLDHRLTAGVGMGYDLVAQPNLEWNITTGPAYQKAWYESSQPGEPTEKSATAITFGTRLDWDITKRIELILDYRGQFTSKEVGETTHHFVTTLSLELTKRFDLDITFTWDRITQPKVGADGIQPQPDDFRLVVGLGLDF